MNTIRKDFIARMKAELESNYASGKGDFDLWIPKDKNQIMREIDHHVEKLRAALFFEIDEERVSEHSADVANACMKCFEVFGNHE
jgi:hypothetical protein